MPETLRDRIASKMHSLLTPCIHVAPSAGSGKTCEAWADALLPLVEQYGDERVAEVDRERDEWEARAWSALEPGHSCDQMARAERAEATLCEVRALADQWERLAAGNEAARGKPTKVAGYYRRCAHMLRAILDREGGER